MISHAVGLSVLNPNTAQFRWPQIADTEDGPINYCGMVTDPRRAHTRPIAAGKRITLKAGFPAANDIGGGRPDRRRQGRRDR